MAFWRMADNNSANAGTSFKNGVLTVTLPRSAKAQELGCPQNCPTRTQALYFAIPSVREVAPIDDLSLNSRRQLPSPIRAIITVSIGWIISVVVAVVVTGPVIAR